MEEQSIPIPAVQLGHAALPDGVRGGEVLLRIRDSRGVHRVDERIRERPRGRGGRARDHMEPDPEPQGPAGRGGEVTHAFDALCDHGRWLTPREIHIHMLGRDGLGRVGRAAEVDLRYRVRDRAGRGTGHAKEVAVVVEGFAGPRAPHHLNELRGLCVPSLLVLMHSEPRQFGGFRAGDDVEEQASVGHALVRGSHLGRKGRREQGRTKRDEKLHPSSQRKQRRRGEPCVLAAGATGGQHGVVPKVITRSSNLGEVLVVRAATMRARTGGQHLTRVPAGRQKPVHLHTVASMRSRPLSTS